MSVLLFSKHADFSLPAPLSRCCLQRRVCFVPQLEPPPPLHLPEPPGASMHASVLVPLACSDAPSEAPLLSSCPLSH